MVNPKVLIAGVLVVAVVVGLVVAGPAGLFLFDWEHPDPSVKSVSAPSVVNSRGDLEITVKVKNNGNTGGMVGIQADAGPIKELYVLPLGSVSGKVSVYVGSSGYSGKVKTGYFDDDESFIVTDMKSVSISYSAIALPDNGGDDGSTPTNHAPSISSLTVPSSGLVDTSVSISATGSDSDGDSLSFDFDFGDGSSSGWGNRIVSHIYGYDGSFSVRVRARDSQGLVGSWSDSQSISVSTPNHPPVVVSGSLSVSALDVDESVSSSVEGNDPEGDSLLYRWDWGDTEPESNWYSSSSRSHTYVSEGIFVVSVMAKDPGGLTSDWKAIGSVTVSDTAAGSTDSNDPGIGSGSFRVSFTLVDKDTNDELVGSLTIDGLTYVVDAGGFIINLDEGEYEVVASSSGYESATFEPKVSGDTDFKLVLEESSDGSTPGFETLTFAVGLLLVLCVVGVRKRGVRADRQGSRRFLKNFAADDSGVVIISRLIAVSAAVIFIAIVHLANFFGAVVPEFLLNPVIDAGILTAGLVIGLIGLAAGPLVLFLALIAVVVGTAYGYFSWILGVI